MTNLKQLACLVVMAGGLLNGSVAQAGTFERAAKNDLDLVKAQVQVSQFLSRATFGPTKADLLIDDTDGTTSLAERVLEIGAGDAFEEWIDLQFDETMTPPPIIMPWPSR